MIASVRARVEDLCEQFTTLSWILRLTLNEAINTMRLVLSTVVYNYLGPTLVMKASLHCFKLTVPPFNTLYFSCTPAESGSSPDASITTSTIGVPSFVPTASISSTISNPSNTKPNTTFLLSSHDVLTVLIKN